MPVCMCERITVLSGACVRDYSSVSCVERITQCQFGVFERLQCSVCMLERMSVLSWHG